MELNFARIVRSLVLLGVGAAVGAAGGAMAYKKLHPPVKPRPDLSGPPGSGSLAPPELPPDEPEPKPPEPEPPVQKPPEPEPPVQKPPDVVAAKPPAGPEFFGFPVGSAERAPEPAPEPKPEPRPEPKPEPKPKPAPVPVIVRLRLMKDRCVAGFDGKSTLHDFSGWTKSVTGEITYEDGRLAETAKASVTVDARTLDTGDADRDAEMHEKHLESGKHPEMKFELWSIKMTGANTMDMSGTLEIHGTKKAVTIPCEVKLRHDKYAWVKGEIKAKMTDFGIEPPVKAGVIKVDDEIRVWFEAWAEPVKAPKK